jgi:hypothetical protein
MASMFRTSLLALIFGFTSVAVFAEDARELTCNGAMIEPSAMSQSPKMATLTLGPAQKLTLDLGQGAVNGRQVSNNKIQLKFRTKDFEGEYFHYTGDLFLIYKSGHLMKLMCAEARKVRLGKHNLLWKHVNEERQRSPLVADGLKSGSPGAL